MKTVYVGDEKIVFERLSLTDLGNLCDDLLAQREKLARDIAAQEKMAKHELVNLVLQIRALKPAVEDVYNGCNAPGGASTVLHKGLEKAGIKDKAERQRLIDLIPTPRALETARALVVDEPDQEEKVDESPLEVPQSTGN